MHHFASALLLGRNFELLLARINGATCQLESMKDNYLRDNLTNAARTWTGFLRIVYPTHAVMHWPSPGSVSR